MTQALNSDAIAAAKKPDFFESKIIRKDNNWKKLNAITIGSYSLKGNMKTAKSLSPPSKMPHGSDTLMESSRITKWQISSKISKIPYTT
jgi:hypothetical protein